MKRRVGLEILVIAMLIGMAVISLSTDHQKQARYTLDHQHIIYNGGMLKGKFNGYGTLKLSNHDHYEGNFKNGQFSGKGTFTSHENWKYQGKFSAGVPNGKGVLTTAKHQKYMGTFSKGELLHAN